MSSATPAAPEIDASDRSAREATDGLVHAEHDRNLAGFRVLDGV